MWSSIRVCMTVRGIDLFCFFDFPIAFSDCPDVGCTFVFHCIVGILSTNDDRNQRKSQLIEHVCVRFLNVGSNFS